MKKLSLLFAAAALLGCTKENYESESDLLEWGLHVSVADSVVELNSWKYNAARNDSTLSFQGKFDFKSLDACMKEYPQYCEREYNQAEYARKYLELGPGQYYKFSWAHFMDDTREISNGPIVRAPVPTGP